MIDYQKKKNEAMLGDQLFIVATDITRDSLTAVLIGPLEKRMMQPIPAQVGLEYGVFSVVLTGHVF